MRAREPCEGHVGEHLGIALAGDEGLDHVTRAFAEDVGDDRVELDPGVGEYLLDALGLAGPLLGELLAVPGQVAEAAHHRVGHEAPSQEAALEQGRKPLGV